ncbi:MAG: collagen-like protein [Cyclobacteriaceae bacterium]|nr:collagen-like protein [Cyclobacteriaceae bacterium]
MKTIFNALLVVMVAVMASCVSEEVGPRGPQGPEGPQGPKGDQGESGYVFEFEDVNFTAPDYEVFLPFPDDFDTYISDVALVYLLWDVVNVNGVDTEIWRQVPQTILTNDGLLQYNFDFSTGDVRLFMEAEFNMDLLGAIDTDDWVVRVVVVPGNFWDPARIDKSNIPYEDIKEMLGLPDMPSPQPEHKRRPV